MFNIIFANKAILVSIIIAIAVIVICCLGYIKAPPDVAYIVSGLRKKPKILIGRAGIRVPFLERVDKAWRDDDARKAEIALVSASNSEKSGHDAATLRNLLTTARDAWAGEDTSERWWRNDIDRYLEEVDELVEFCVRYNQPANVYAIYDGVGMVVGIGTRLIFLYQPSVLISHSEPVKDYTDVSVGELRALAGKKGGGVSATLPASPLDTVSVSQAQNELSDKKAALEALRASIREVEDGTKAVHV